MRSPVLQLKWPQSTVRVILSLVVFNEQQNVYIL